MCFRMNNLRFVLLTVTVALTSSSLKNKSQTIINCRQQIYCYLNNNNKNNNFETLSLVIEILYMSQFSNSLAYYYVLFVVTWIAEKETFSCRVGNLSNCLLVFEWSLLMCICVFIAIKQILGERIGEINWYQTLTIATQERVLL